MTETKIRRKLEALDRKKAGIHGRIERLRTEKQEIQELRPFRDPSRAVDRRLANIQTMIRYLRTDLKIVASECRYYRDELRSLTKGLRTR